jgi:hypothetical protein
MPVAASDPSFSQARDDLLEAVEQRVVGCRFSEEWVDYLYLLPAFVRHCRGYAFHLIDPLASSKDGLDSVTTRGIGYRLRRYLPLILGRKDDSIWCCYYELEGPACLVLAHESAVVSGVWDQRIDDWIRDHGHRLFAPPVSMLSVLTARVRNQT